MDNPNESNELHKANISPLSQISSICLKRYPSNIDGFDRVLDGGIVEGSTIFFAGVAGIGKSTLVLQLCYHISRNHNKKILYVCGEESSQQIKQRAERLKINSDDIFLLEDVKLENIVISAFKYKPDIIVVDSLQMIYTDRLNTKPMTPSQMRYCLMTLCKFAKKTNTTVIFIGHATKTGNIAGLATFQHMVDTVLFLSYNKDNKRVLMVNKNRFGKIGEEWVIEMTDEGLISADQTHEVNYTYSKETLKKLLKGHWLWKPIVTASLSFLQKRYKEEYENA